MCSAEYRVGDLVSSKSDGGVPSIFRVLWVVGQGSCSRSVLVGERIGKESRVASLEWQHESAKRKLAPWKMHKKLGTQLGRKFG